MHEVIIYIIREEGSIFAPQRIPFCMALGVAVCTVGKVRVSTVFMCVCSTFRPSDFLLFVKNGFVVGVRCHGNSESLKECEYPHCASATRRLALDNNRNILCSVGQIALDPTKCQASNAIVF